MAASSTTKPVAPGPCCEGAWRWLAPAVLVLAALLLFARLGDRALWAMELRWAEIPREMGLTGDYFRPTINGHLYYDKPLGSYWLVLAASFLTGSIDETAARLPSAVSGLLSVVLLMVIARRLHDSRTALLAGFILATSFSFVFFARHASADCETIAGELAALALFLRHEKQPRGWWVVVLWLIMALTSLTKGLLGFALPLLVIGVYSTLKSGARGAGRGAGDAPPAPRPAFEWLVQWRTGVGIVVAVLVYFTPFFLAADASDLKAGLAMVFRENLQRFFQPHNHIGPAYLYAYVIFALLAPWSVLLPAALVQARQSRTDPTDADRFGRAWFWATFLFFTLSASRRSYYLLPILPAGALLTARLLTTPIERLSAWARALLRCGQVTAIIAVVVAGVGLLPRDWVLPEPWHELPALPAPFLFGLIWLTCLVGLLWTWKRLEPGRVGLAFAALAYLALFYLFVMALPALEGQRGDRLFACEVKEQLGPDLDGLAFFRTREAVFYLDTARPIPEYDTAEALLSAVQIGQVRWLILRERDFPPLHLAGAIVLRKTVFPWDDAAQRGNKAILVRLAGGTPLQ
jgi:4-amino-4-deoxy-L-arabinose transferase-like glycosyltransferase